MYVSQLIAVGCLMLAVGLSEAKHVYMHKKTSIVGPGPLTNDCEGDYQKCPTSEKCISRHWFCDGDNDCGDSSEEQGCESRVCPEGSLRCNNGQCIVAESFCSRSASCRDGTRFEAGTCPDVACPDGQRKCPRFSVCIPDRYFCDGDNDCGDDSDEENCGLRECSSGMEKCPTRSKCIDVSHFCDGHNHCSDNSDEENCANRVCPEGYLQCNNGQCITEQTYCSGSCSDGTLLHDVTCPDVECEEGQRKCARLSKCIKSSFFCDGENDCQDKSDEPANCRERQCDVGEFKCNNGQCLNLAAVCLHGDSYLCKDDTNTSTMCFNIECPESHTRCVSDGKCIPNHALCDGSQNCNDGSDEAAHHCKSPMECTDSDYSACPSVRRCINKRYFCDTDDDCGDNSDEEESFCRTRICQPDQVRCNSGQCIDKDAFCSSIYSCRDGSLQPDSEICGASSSVGQGGPSATEMQCIMGMMEAQSTCLNDPFIEEMGNWDSETAIEKLSAIDMQELCGHVKQPLHCFKNSFSGCSNIGSQLIQRTNSQLAAAEGTFDIVCVQEIDTVNRHKACLLKTEEGQSEPQLAGAIPQACGHLLAERNCNTESLVACVKNVVAAQCGDEIAEVIATIGNREGKSILGCPSYYHKRSNTKLHKKRTPAFPFQRGFFRRFFFK